MNRIKYYLKFFRFKGIGKYAGLIFLLFFTFGAGSLQMQKEEIQVIGRVYVMGNEPFTEVAVTTDDGRVFALTGEYDQELRRLQGKRLKIVGQAALKTARGAESIEVKSYEVLESK